MRLNLLLRNATLLATAGLSSLACTSVRVRNAEAPRAETLRTIRDARAAIDSARTGLVIVDGIIITDATSLDSLPPDEVISIEFVYGSGLRSGGPVAQIVRCHPVVLHEVRWWRDRVVRDPSCPWTAPPRAER